MSEDISSLPMIPIAIGTGQVRSVDMTALGKDNAILGSKLYYHQNNCYLHFMNP